MQMSLEPVGFVRSGRPHPEDDNWGGQTSTIELTERFTAEALAGLADFSHAEVVFFFHRVDPARIITAARHPRNNPDWPAVGIFAQRAKNRPNRIGTTICRIVRCEDTRLTVAELDAIDGTPVLDIKPLLTEFLPRDPVRQPPWAHEVMHDYWSWAKR